MVHTTQAGSQEPNIHRVCSVLAHRFNFAVAATAMRSAGLQVGRSWRETEERVRELDEESPSVVRSKASILASLETLSTIHDKRVVWLNYAGESDKTKTEFERWAAEAPDKVLVDEDWSDKYPFPLVPVIARSLKHNSLTPVLCQIRSGQGYIYFYYFSVRVFNERVELETNLIKSDTYKNLNDYSKIIGVVERHAPCFDVVAVDFKAKRIEMRVDIPPGNVPAEAQTIAFQRLEIAFNEAAYRTGLNVMALPRNNLLPLMRPLYGDPKAGVITMLGFEAVGEESASNNTGRPVRRSRRDLRLDEFHKIGAAGVKDIRPYTMEVLWPKPGDARKRLSIEIPGSLLNLYKGAHLSVANLYGCTNLSDFSLLLDRIDHFQSMAAARARQARQTSTIARTAIKSGN